MSSLTLIKNTSEHDVFDAALEVSKKRRSILLALKVAIRANDLTKADQLVTELVPDDKEGHTAPESLNRGAGRTR
jgi:hypothetical protein